MSDEPMTTPNPGGAMSSVEKRDCPKCGTPCDRDEVDVGVGVICGPWGCSGCGWSEDERYDLSDGQPRERNGGVIDPRGGWTPSAIAATE